jgi:cytochrome c
MHKGLFGRRAGSMPGFAYLAAMRSSGIVWSEAALEQFLPASPAPRERADLSARLKQATKP